MAKEAGVQLATTLSDMSMINFCRAGLEAMVGNDLDYLFCNEEEAQVWCGSTDFPAIVEQMSKLARVVCLTRGSKGCLVIEGAQRSEVPAAKVKAIDTNGAGDMFAGAFMFAVTHGHSHIRAAELANRAAGQVVSQYGNRLTPEQMQAIRQEFEAAS
jgi:sugar/nucleoside kinase (ribokinase family)